MQFHLERLETPTGQMLIVTDEDQALRAADWTTHEARMIRLLGRHYGEVTFKDPPVPTRALAAFKAYFAGDTAALEHYPTATGGTEFQRRVWSALRDIGVGETKSYAGLAAAIDRPKAVRAVGLANGANPIAIAVPCHRVIGANASLTGYGGGLERKKWLLEFERGA